MNVPEQFEEEMGAALLIISQHECTYPVEIHNNQLFFPQHEVEKEADSKKTVRRRRRRGSSSKGGDGDGVMRKRKLSEEQADMLERSFGSEKKLESQRKDKLAAELGLDPRQVAVWFQNRRARWRTKMLQDQYSNLRAQHQTTLIHKSHLQAEILKLKAQLDEANKEMQKLKEQRSNGIRSISPSSSSSIDTVEPFLVGEDFGMGEFDNVFNVLENNYEYGLGWDGVYYV